MVTIVPAAAGERSVATTPCQSSFSFNLFTWPVIGEDWPVKSKRKREALHFPGPRLNEVHRVAAA
jgi:hypothetical protein